MPLGQLAGVVQAEGMRTQPSLAVGTPAKPSGHSHCPDGLHSELGPQATLHASLHLPLMHCLKGPPAQSLLEAQPFSQMPRRHV